jgi:hypothetical protein
MRVYASTNSYSKENLVGIIDESGQVYKYLNGKKKLWGRVRKDYFYGYDKNYEEVLISRYDDLPKMGGGGEIYIDVGDGEGGPLVGFMDSRTYYYAEDIDKLSMIGFHVGEYLFGDGCYAAAYWLIIDGK